MGMPPVMLPPPSRRSFSWERLPNHVGIAPVKPPSRVRRSKPVIDRNHVGIAPMSVAPRPPSRNPLSFVSALRSGVPERPLWSRSNHPKSRKVVSHAGTEPVKLLFLRLSDFNLVNALRFGRTPEMRASRTLKCSRLVRRESQLGSEPRLLPRMSRRVNSDRLARAAGSGPAMLLLPMSSVRNRGNRPSAAGTLPPSPRSASFNSVTPAAAYTTPFQPASGVARPQFSLPPGSSAALAASSVSQSRTKSAFAASPPQGRRGTADTAANGPAAYSSPSFSTPRTCRT